MHLVWCFFLYFVSGISAIFENEITLKCKGKSFKNVTLTAYYPDYTNSDQENGYQDMKGKKLRTLQDYIDNRADFVTLAMDKKLSIPYGTRVCIPELNEHFGHRILLEVRDTSYELTGTGYNRADICVRSEIDSYDINVNRFVTLVLV
ncbi:uncharacterized protein LOC130895618 [Diorhabda carinulata]|uniref:uncharacterized protein LOC130895618 n=1 Tax=Diorhabda carinulata TaxID=1163345 RepID=UPI0025A2EA53|nr:uncharacterized protein LOC130895618 [Diorhabda carinulata]